MKRVPVIVEVVKYGTVRVITEDSHAEFTLKERDSEVVDLQTLEIYNWCISEGCGPLFVWHKFLQPSVTGNKDTEYSVTIYNLQEQGYPLHELDMRDKRLNTILFVDEMETLSNEELLQKIKEEE